MQANLIAPSRRRRKHVVAVGLLAILLAGCTSPAATRDQASDAAAALPSSLDIDLHDYVLNITMPEGQPTMLVALNVTKDMWVRPIVNPSGQARVTTSDEYWILCPWTRTAGLPEPWEHFVIPFWLQDGEIVLTSADIGRSSLPRGDDNGGCDTNPRTIPDTKQLRADDPVDGTLFLLFAVRPDVTPEFRDQIQAPDPPGTFSLSIAIATNLCDEMGGSYCPSSREVVVEPTVRGGVPIQRRAGHLNVEPYACQDCGFNVTDERTYAGPVPVSGRVAFERTGAVPRGITIAEASGGGAGREGAANVEVTLSSRGLDLAGRCTGTADNFGVILLAAHDEPTSFQADFEMTGVVYGLQAIMLEIPIDITALPGRLEPTVANVWSGHAYGFTGKGSLCE